MSERDWATLIGFAVFVGLRVLDYILPRGRHITWIERWTRPDDTKRTQREDEKG